MKKVDLHCHLDGSLNIDFVADALKRLGVISSRPELEAKLRINSDCTSLTEYLEKFDLPLQCLQTKDNLKQAAYELVADLAKDDVIYAEIRFAPMLFTHNGLSCEEVIESVLEGMQRGEKEFDIYTQAIVCAMRHHSLGKNMKMLEEARKFVGHGVCALDLAGDESTYPTKNFRELFVKAKEWNIPFTIHAGECGSRKSIQDAIEFGASRIGHGIALTKSRNLRNICREKGIGIEMCPTSNLQTKAVENMEEYPLQQFLDEGLSVSINTDNRTVSDTTMDKEQSYFSDEVILQCTKNAVEMAFVCDEIKKELMRKIIEV